jgi:hypothetical protein
MQPGHFLAQRDFRTCKSPSMTNCGRETTEDLGRTASISTRHSRFGCERMESTMGHEIVDLERRFWVEVAGDFYRAHMAEDGVMVLPRNGDAGQAPDHRCDRERGSLGESFSQRHTRHRSRRRDPGCRVPGVRQQAGNTSPQNSGEQRLRATRQSDAFIHQPHLFTGSRVNSRPRPPPHHNCSGCHSL